MGNVEAMLQLDMLAYSGADTFGVVDEQWTDAGLASFVTLLLKEYGIPVASMQCGYACSDHASYNRAGYRSTFLFEAPSIPLSNPQIHTADDTADHVDGT